MFYNIFKVKYLVRSRNFSSKPNKKYINSINKALFGAVIKTPKPKKNTCQDEIVPEKPENSNLNSTKDYDISSEIYWLTQHKAPVIFTTSETHQTKLHIKSGTLDQKKSSSKIQTKKSIIKNNTKSETVSDSLKALNECLLPTPELNNEFYLSKENLKMVLNFPLNPGDNSTNYKSLNTDHIPSVTTILQATMPEAARKALIRWKLMKIAELGEDGFRELQKQHLTIGSEFHSSLQNYLKTKKLLEYKPPLKELWGSVSDILLKLDPEPVLIETSLKHPILQYKGIVDCVCNIDNELTVIEWKKSERPKSTIEATYDAPLQLCAYLGAINADPLHVLNIRKGLIVVAYTNGKPADIYALSESNLRKCWRLWLQRIQEYWIRCRDGTLPEPI